MCGRDRTSESCFWYLVPFKGCDFPAFDTLVKRIVRNLIRLGYKRAAFRSDGEPAIQAVMNAVIQAWPGEVIPEQSAEGDHSSNGNAEGGVSIMKGHVRTCKISLEHKLGSEIPETHPLLSWLVYYACQAYNRYHLGPDGRSPRERVLGRRVSGPVACFSESI